VLADYMKVVDADHSLALLAETQHGLVTRRQALERGLSARAIQGRLESGRWERMFRGVFRIAGTEASYRQWVRSATLAAGTEAVASHRSAATLIGLPGTARWLEVTIPPSRRMDVDGIIVHRAHLVPRDRCSIDLIPVTTPVRTLLDLAGELSEQRLGTVLDHALGNRLVTRAELEQRLADLRSRGRRGLGVLAGLLAARPVSARPIQAGFESRLLRALTAAGLPLPSPQYGVALPSGRMASVDFAYPEVLLAIEADSYVHHSTLTGWSRDRARNNGLVALGWAVLPITWDLLTKDPAGVVDQVRGALDARRLLYLEG